MIDYAKRPKKIDYVRHTPKRPRVQPPVSDLARIMARLTARIQSL